MAIAKHYRLQHERRMVNSPCATIAVSTLCKPARDQARYDIETEGGDSLPSEALNDDSVTVTSKLPWRV